MFIFVLINNKKRNKVLILSKKKDYYDGVVGTMGVDKTIVYERNIIEIDDNKDMPKEFQSNKNDSWHKRRENHFLNLDYMNTNSKKYDNNHFFLVGFCGKLYLGWKFDYNVKEKDERGVIVDVTKTDIIYGYENAKDHLKDGYWKSNIKEDINYVLNYDPINIFRELKTPVFIYDNDESNFRHRVNRNSSMLIINPVLKNYEFYKVIDAFTAFQEIQMFLGGVLGIDEKEIINVDDKYKIPQHGFDKWSFRREPQKNKYYGISR